MKKAQLMFMVFMMGIMTACAGESVVQETDEEDEYIANEYIADDMTVTYEEDKEFIVLRVKDDYMEISGNCQDVYLSEGGKYPELSDGEAAWIKADVEIYDGGEAGYMGNLFIEDLKQYEILDYNDVVERLEVPDCVRGEDQYEWGKYLCKYQVDGKYYFVVLNGMYIEVYLDGEFVKEYDWTSLEEDELLEPFWTEVIGNETKE